MVNCNGCGKPIKFDGEVRSRSGKMIPLEPNGEYHKCPAYVNKFEQNRQQYGQGYSGPSQQNQMQTEVANLVSDMAVMKDQILGLQKAVNGLGEAIAKVSFTTANKLEETEDDTAEV